MSRENAPAKARRYLGEGRLTVTFVDGDRVTATCKGDGRVYRVTVAGEAWHCDCDARGRCSHLYALGLVVSTRRTP